MNMIQTVLGDIEPKEAGLTLIHEHVAFDSYRQPIGQPRHDWTEVVEAASKELGDMVAEGLRTLVEATTIGNGRSPTGLAEISRRTGLHIVATTGFWCDPPLLELVSTDHPDVLADLLAREIEAGMDGTDVRAGVIKFATSELMTEAEERAARAAARASRRTGAPIITHTQRGALALEQLDMFAEEGADLSRVVVGHLGGKADLQLHLQAAKRGALLGYDRIGQGHEQDDDACVPLVAEMVRRGYSRQIVLSQDTSVYLFGVRRQPLPSHMGGHSLHERPAYNHVLHGFAPRLKALGVTDDDLHTMMVKNPARILPVQYHR